MDISFVDSTKGGISISTRKNIGVFIFFNGMHDIKGVSVRVPSSRRCLSENVKSIRRS